MILPIIAASVLSDFNIPQMAAKQALTAWVNQTVEANPGIFTSGLDWNPRWSRAILTEYGDGLTWTEIEPRTTHAVVGRFTPEEAFCRLFRGVIPYGARVGVNILVSPPHSAEVREYWYRNCLPPPPIHAGRQEPPRSPPAPGGCRCVLLGGRDWPQRTHVCEDDEGIHFRSELCSL